MQAFAPEAFWSRPSQEWVPDQWGQLFTEVLRYTVQPHEDMQDVLAGGWALGGRRARLTSREIQPWADVPYALCLFTWWPFKPSLNAASRDYVLQRRWPLFQGAAADPRVEDRFVQVVRDDVLRLETGQLFGLLRTQNIWDLITFPS